MPEYTYNDIIYSYNLDSLTAIVIGNNNVINAVIETTLNIEGISYNVDSIGSNAFFNNGGLLSVIIPNSITSIGESAFNSCSALTSIIIPDSVTSIGSNAFYDCSALTSITIPNSVTSIGDGAFSYCTSLTTITIPDSVISIERFLFDGCSALTSAILSNSVTTIPHSMFNNCRSLTSIIIPDSVTSIGYNAFYECSALTSITIPNSVTSIGGTAFSSCYSLTTITIPNSVTSIGESAFSSCYSLTTITIPDSITSIEDSMFDSCSSLTTIILPNSITSIGESIFSFCSSFKSITIPDSVTTIGATAFEFSSLIIVNISPQNSLGIESPSSSISFYGATVQTVLPVPILSNFIISTKLIGDPSFLITQPDSTSNGAFSYTSSNESVATIIGNEITIVSVGITYITATQEETSNYASGSIVTSLQIIQNKLLPLLSNFIIPVKTYGESPFQLINPTSDSDGAFTYTSSNESVATVIDNEVTIIGFGITDIVAIQAETSIYNSGSITTTFQVNKALPILTNFSIPRKSIGDSSFALTQPVSTNIIGEFTYISSDQLVATIDGNMVTIVGVGISNIVATQLETSNYTSAIINSQLLVNQDPSTPLLSNFSILSKTYGEAPFILIQPTSDSNGTFTYTSSNESVATINENIVTIVGVGISDITAIQAATDYYTSGSIMINFQVNPSSPTLSNFSISTKVFGEASFQITNPVSNSDGAFTYTSSDALVATIIGNEVTIVGVGISNIIAIQEASGNYTSGTIVTQLLVNEYKLLPVLSNFSISTKVYGEAPFLLTQPDSTSDGAFTYISSDATVASINGNIVTIIRGGNCNITAIQAATSVYESGSITASFLIIGNNQIEPLITNFNISTKIYGEAPFLLTQPDSTSDGAFTYTSSNTLVATIIGNEVEIVGVGNADITATQAATDNYTSGSITTTFQVNPSSPTNPSSISTGNELLYFLNTDAEYCIINDSIVIHEELTSSSYKILLIDNNNVKIIKNVLN